MKPLQRVVLLTAVACSLGSAATVRNILTYKGPYVGSQCSLPAPTTSSFAAADQSVYAFVLLDGVKATDSIVAGWTLGASRQYNTTFGSVSLDGSYCWSEVKLDISAFTPASFGTWTLQVFVNGIAINPAATFVISGPTVEPRGPTLSGSFDPIPSDCSHFFGWAASTDASSPTVSVEIKADGALQATVDASDYRQDVGNHAWNFYNLQRLLDGASHTIRVYYAGTTLELPPIGGRQFPPTDAQPGACGVTSGPPTQVTVNWVSGGGPPQSLTSGQSQNVRWQVAGARQIQSRLCYGTSTDPTAMCQQHATAWQSSGANTSGVFTDSLIASVVSSPQTLYATVQAQAGGQNVYLQPVAQIGVSPLAPPPSSIQTWVYTPRNQPNLLGMTIVLQREPMNAGYQYRLSVVGDDIEPWVTEAYAASLTVLCKHSDAIKVHRGSLSGLMIYDTPFLPVPSTAQILQNIDGAPWQTQSRVVDSGAILLQYILGFVPFVGPSISTVSAFSELVELWGKSPAVGPSATLAKELGNDDYDVYSVTLSSSLYPMRASRFTVNVDETGGEKPHFFLLVKAAGVTVGVEVRDYPEVPIVRALGF